jgi:hypothetical protein
MDMTNIIITGIVGALTGLVAAFLKNRFDYQHEVRSDLWNKRFESYIRIWKITQLIPKWPRNEKLSYKGLYELSKHFQDWYFQDGGILLSSPARQKYGDMQEAMTTARLSQEKLSTDAILNEDDYNKVQTACSNFRTAITNELLSRKTTK